MRNESFQSGHPRSLALVTVPGLLVICALAVMAQSGRRAPRSSPLPAPTPESTPTPTAKSPEKPALPLIVGIDTHDSFSGIPLYFNDSVLESCVERLRDAHSVSVEVASRDLGRGEAVKRAKAEKEGYVVMLQLRLDGMGASGNANLTDVYIEYFVFAPTTAKQVASGRTYQQAYRNRGVVMGPGTSGNGVYAEYRLKQAARDAAERILHEVHTSPPAGRPLPQP